MQSRAARSKVIIRLLVLLSSHTRPGKQSSLAQYEIVRIGTFVIGPIRFDGFARTERRKRKDLVHRKTQTLTRVPSPLDLRVVGTTRIP